MTQRMTFLMSPLLITEQITDVDAYEIIDFNLVFQHNPLHRPTTTQTHTKTHPSHYLNYTSTQTKPWLYLLCMKLMFYNKLLWSISMHLFLISESKIMCSYPQDTYWPCLKTKAPPDTLKRDPDSRHRFFKEVEKGQFNVKSHSIFRQKSLPSRRNASPAWSTEGQRNRIFSLVIFSHVVLHWIHTGFTLNSKVRAIWRHPTPQSPYPKPLKSNGFFPFDVMDRYPQKRTRRDSQIPAQCARRPSRKPSTCFPLRSAEARAILLPPVDAPRSSASFRPH